VTAREYAAARFGRVGHAGIEHTAPMLAFQAEMLE
jgi:hypothetical protein